MASRNTVLIMGVCFYLFIGVMSSMIFTDIGVERDEEIETGTFFTLLSWINSATFGLVDAIVNGFISFLEWFGASIDFTLDLSGQVQSLFLGFSEFPTWLNALIFVPPATLLGWNLVTGLYPSGGN